MEKTYISNIQRFSLDDGPGIRTTIFFKGCNLKCLWCHNPECISQEIDLQFQENMCKYCGACNYICPMYAHHVTENSHLIDRTVCKKCGRCVSECKNRALKLIGIRYKVDEVIEIIKKDIDFYKISGGGVTFSGGEPMLALPMLKEILIQCKKMALHTAVDTAGNVDYKDYQEIFPYIDLFLYDMKIYDAEDHKKYTGVYNDKIIDNIKKLSRSGKDIFVRIPVIGGVNDTKKELEYIADFLADLKTIKLIQLLPYHNYGVVKYKALGFENRQLGLYVPDDTFMNEMITMFREKKLNVSF